MSQNGGILHVNNVQCYNVWFLYQEGEENRHTPSIIYFVTMLALIYPDTCELAWCYTMEGSM